MRRLPPDELPLFAAARQRELGREPETTLPALTLGEAVAGDYQTTRLSLKAHPMALLRPLFAAEGVIPCAQLAEIKPGTRVRIAGVVLVRQRPGKGKAVFITIEDEDGIANIVLWASDLEPLRRAVMTSRLMLVDGVVERGKEGVTHIMARHITDRGAALATLTNPDSPTRSPTTPVRAGHPRNVRIIPRSRDFH